MSNNENLDPSIVWCRWSGSGSIKCNERTRRGWICKTCPKNPEVKEGLNLYTDPTELIKIKPKYWRKGDLVIPTRGFASVSYWDDVKAWMISKEWVLSDKEVDQREQESV